MVTPFPMDSNTSDKGLNDWIFDKELMQPLAGLITSITFKTEINFGAEVFATGEKESPNTGRVLQYTL